MMSSCERELITGYRLLLILLLLVIPVITEAQGNGGDIPCDGQDPFNSDCPLDTWVIALVIIAVIFTALHLQRKQKSLQA